MPSHSMQVADIVVDEAGSPNPKEWAGTASSLGCDLDAIRFHADRNVIDLEERLGNVVIKGKYRTGIVLLPSGRRIVLRLPVRKRHREHEWLEMPQLTRQLLG